MLTSYLKNNLTPPGGVVKLFKMLTYTYMLRFFIASRLASGRDLFFDIACSQLLIQNQSKK